jgi:hypothetical protein
MPARYSVILVALVIFHPWPHDCTPEHDEPYDDFSYVVRADQHGHRIPDPCRREPRVPLLPLVLFTLYQQYLETDRAVQQCRTTIHIARFLEIITAS